MATAIIISCIILFVFLLAISICKSAAEDDHKIDVSFQNDLEQQEEDEPAPQENSLLGHKIKEVYIDEFKRDDQYEPTIPAHIENYLQNLYKKKHNVKVNLKQ